MSQKANQGPRPDDFTLVEHLTELRTRLVHALVAIVLFSGIAWAFSDRIMDFIRAPIVPYLPTGGLTFTGPTDKFMAHLKISMLAGIIASCPVWIYQIWRFVEPGLYVKEKKYGRYFIFFGSFLFISGVCFSYYLVLPAAFKVLMAFGGTVDKPMITIDNHVGFFMMTTLVFGAAFEMPLVIVLLGLMGFVTSRGLRHIRRYAYVFIAVVAAVFTPPDAISMALLGVPLCLLYELSILVLRIVEPRSNRA